MRTEKALQRQKDDRWDYCTVSSKGHCRPMGYCAGWREYQSGELGLPDDQIEKLNEFKQQFKGSYHTDGHATRDEAEECYKKYLIDQRLRLDGHMPDTQKKCQSPAHWEALLEMKPHERDPEAVLCGEWTQGYATVDGDTHRFYLCDEHRTRECVDLLMPSPAVTWTS
jgi:hypothetical protein